jgi:CheY-like chemotaxis protein
MGDAAWRCLVVEDDMSATTPPMFSPMILVVDDDPDLRQALHLALGDAGYGVLEAANGVEALAVLRDHVEPMVIVLDNKMPHLDGSYLVELLAADPSLGAQHRLVLISGDVDAFRRAAPALDRLQERLQAVVLAKPFELDAFREAVAQAAAGLAELAGGEDVPAR